jgi:acyl-[acyl-carrier-protein]-phospholipid O-acyltransferase / long-chain-fatty-acid--[acyl-carrier-protein] ligase
MQRLLRAVLKPLLKAFFKLLFRLRVTGRDDAFLARPLLIVANHESFLDGLLLGLYLPVNPVFVVHTGVPKMPVFRLILSLTDYLPVDPMHPMAMRTVVKLLESGRPVVIFPEGRITTTGSLMKVYDGPAFAAAKSGATIVPVRIDGASRTYFSRVYGDHPKRFFPRLTLSVQTPTRIDMPEAATARARRQKAGEGMRRIMQQMLFDSHPPQSLCSALVDAVAIHGRKREAIEDMQAGAYSYGGFLKMTLALSRLTGKVTLPGEHVGVLMPNAASTLALIFGLNAGRRIPAMLNFTAGRDGMQNACTAAGVRTVITSRAFLEKAELTEVVAGLQGLRIVCLEDLRAGMNLLDKLWLMAFALWLPRLAMAEPDPESPAIVLFTSGTEGKPKGVALSHRALLANIAQVRAVVDVNATDKVLDVLPMFHSFGLTGGALLPVLTGARVLFYPTPLHYKIIPELAYDRGCTVLYGTSTFLGNYARHANPYDFHRMRYVIAGAEKLAENVRQAWIDKFGIRILEGYGATETAPVLALNTPMANRPGSVGQLLPGIEAKVIPVPGIDNGGLLHVRGPNVMSGYYRFEAPGVLEPTNSEAGEGWYNTGDVVELDADGYLYIRGRVKRFAKVAGEMVSLGMVEELAVQVSPQGAHAAAACSDPKRGEAVVLFSTDAELSRDRLQAAARDLGLPELAVPRDIRVVEALPLLGTGKVDYVTLGAMAAGG